MIQSHINFTQECGVVPKLERFFHLSGRSFVLGLRPYQIHLGKYIKKINYTMHTL